MGLETLLADAGGMGRFQWVAMVIIYMGKAFCGWSVLQMTFAGIIPDFSCESETSENDRDVHHDSLPLNVTLNKCSIPGNGSVSSSGTEESCSSYNFTGSYRTVITEFNLVCDYSWVKPTVTSIQMLGLMVGSILAGQLGDSWGRWKTNLLCALTMALSNIGTAFSNCWEVFAFCRFMIGMGIGR
ncbi:solute carrier family 22 member 21 [Elysia marginata]|uniref:Solute carrier family 22 member 21 n=1 Tax=Elysia marginata TaxID=1093978 RepID=A0AAV4G6U7_9GAST|nr:solute carrier family 22 member 21 [Elysia marginata]